jgi:hypothetical protein
MKPQNMITFSDPSGRTIIGKLVSETSSELVVKNPAVLFIQPTEANRLSVQLFEYFFKDLVSPANRENGTEWKFSKSGISIATDLELDEKLIQRYDNLFTTSKIITPGNSGGVVKLFDD